MRKHLVQLTAMAFVGCVNPTGPTPGDAPVAEDAKPSFEAKVTPEILAAVARGEERKLLVVFDEQSLDREARALGWKTTSDLDANAARKAVLFTAAKQDLLARVSPSQMRVERDFDRLPVIAVRTASIEALSTVLEDRNVARVQEERKLSPRGAKSLELIGQPIAQAEGKDGAGTAIAVIDTGVDFTLPVFGPCLAPGVPNTCRVAAAIDFAAEDGERDDFHKHGTDDAAIAASVAPGAQILSLDVCDADECWEADIVSAFNWVINNKTTYNIAAISVSLGAGRSTSHCSGDALTTAIASARAAGMLTAVAAGNDGYADSSAWPACAPSAISVGAVWAEDLSYTTWYSDHLWDYYPRADQVAAFSNSPPFLTLLAPGAHVVSASRLWYGTSIATPHVAGAVAVLRAAFPAETMDETVTRLTATGRPIVDRRNHRVTPRLDLAAASGGCFFKLSPERTNVGWAAGSVTVTLSSPPSCPWSISSDSDWLSFPNGSAGTGGTSIVVNVAASTAAFRAGKIAVGGAGLVASAGITQGIDASPPSGTVLINGGAAMANTERVWLQITAEDPSGVYQMCVTNGTTCSAWEAFARTKIWDLSFTASAKVVTVFFRDWRGNISTLANAASDSIVVDRVRPTDGTVTATRADSQLTLNFSGFHDSDSGIAEYLVAFEYGREPPVACYGNGIIYRGSAPTFVHSGLINGAEHAYRVCARDAAGNYSWGKVVVGVPAPEIEPPVGTVTINGGALYTRVSRVTLAISATDASGVKEMSVRNHSSTAPSWVPYQTSLSHDLAGGAAGARSVYVRFKDLYGNESGAFSAAPVIYDPTPPMNGQVTAVAESSKVELRWSGFYDQFSGIAKYRVVYSNSAVAPGGCDGPPLAYEGIGLSLVDYGLQNGQPISYRVCAIDRAGNFSTGVAVTRVPAPEQNPPVGTVVINGGAAYTNSTSVTLTLSATDESGVSAVCLSSGIGCPGWQAFQTSMAFSLLPTSGVQRVYAWFKDAYSTTTIQAASDTIVYDPIAPLMGTLSAGAGTGKVTLVWTNAADSLSGIASYRLVSLPGAVAPPPGCTSGTELVSAKVNTFIHSVPTGTTTSYRLCAVDGAGNTSSGIVKTATPL